MKYIDNCVVAANELNEWHYRSDSKMWILFVGSSETAYATENEIESEQTIYTHTIENETRVETEFDCVVCVCACACVYMRGTIRARIRHAFVQLLFLERF